MTMSDSHYPFAVHKAGHRYYHLTSDLQRQEGETCLHEEWFIAESIDNERCWLAHVTGPEWNEQMNSRVYTTAFLCEVFDD